MRLFEGGHLFEGGRLLQETRYTILLTSNAGIFLVRDSIGSQKFFDLQHRPPFHQICKLFTRSFNFRGRNLSLCPTFVPFITSNMRE